MNELKKTIIWIGIFITGVLALYPLLRVGIVTGDDLGYMLWPTDHFAQDAKIYAEGTGRFYFLITLWIYKIPYLIEAPWFFHTMLIAPIILSFVLFIWLVYRIFKDEVLTLLTAIIIFSIYQISGGHSATAAYPFYFAFSFSLLLCSFHLLLSYYKTNSYKYILLSSIVLAITTIFYESYLVFYFLIFLVIIHPYKYRWRLIKENFNQIVKELLPFVLLGLAYLVIYFIYYKSCQTQYSGNTFSSDFNFALFTKAMGNMAFYGLPLSSLYDYQFFLTEYSLAFSQTEHLFKLIFTQAGIVSYLKGFIVVALFVLATQQFTTKIKSSVVAVIWGISLLFIFLPHLPLALSEKYSTSIQNAYVTTYFSFFAVVVFLIFSGLMLSNIRNKIIKKGLYFSSLLLIFFVSLTTQFINERVADDLEVAQRRLDLMEKMLIEKHIPNGSHVYLEPLHHSTSYFSKSITRQSSPFETFAKQKNGLSIIQHLDYSQFYKTFKTQQGNVYLIHFSQAAKTGDAQMVISEIRGDQLTERFCDNMSDKLYVGYLSNYKKFGISLATDSSAPLFINNEKISSLGNFHYGNITFLDKPDVAIFTLHGSKMKPSTLNISHNLYPNLAFISVNKFSKHYQARWVRHIMHNLEKNQEFIRLIEKKSLEQGISYRQALKNDATWLLYNEFQ